MHNYQRLAEEGSLIYNTGLASFSHEDKSALQLTSLQLFLLTGKEPVIKIRVHMSAATVNNTEGSLNQGPDAGVAGYHTASFI